MKRVTICSFLFLFFTSTFYSQTPVPTEETPQVQHEFYEEIGLPKEVVDKMTADQILELVYHKDAHAERMEHDYHSGNSGPSNFLIFSIITAGLITLILIILGTYYYHFMIKKSQHDLLYKAIEEGQELPENIFKNDTLGPAKSLGLIAIIGGAIFCLLMIESHGPWPIGVGIITLGLAILLLKKRTRSYV